MTGVAACRVCGCTDADCSGCIEATGVPCHWIAPDLCSRCSPVPAAPKVTYAQAEELAARRHALEELCAQASVSPDTALHFTSVLGWIGDNGALYVVDHLGADPERADHRGEYVVFRTRPGDAHPAQIADVASDAAFRPAEYREQYDLPDDGELLTEAKGAVYEQEDTD